MTPIQTTITKRQKVLRVIGACAVIVFITSWFWIGLLDNEYVTWPREPQPRSGRLVPYGVKGITVYITARDQELHTWLMRGLIASGISAVIFLLASGELQRILNPKR